MAVVLPGESCIQTSHLWMSTKQSTLASLQERRRGCRNYGKRCWFVGSVSASTAAGGGICLRYSPYRCPPSRCVASSSGRRSLRLLIRDHETSRGQLPSSPVKPVAKICRLQKWTSVADWEAAEDQEATSSKTEMEDKEPGGEGSSRSATTRRTVGAVCLIIGTSIGSGILALPQRTSAAGFIPSATSMVVCWGFLLVEALLIAEVNVSLLNMNMRSKKLLLAEKATAKHEKDDNLVNGDQELESISFRTMAVETLGDLGGSVATVTYVFLGYTSLVAYCSKSGELLSQLVSLPPALLGSSFTALTAALICFGGYRVADGVNQWLTAVMIGLLVVIEVTAGTLDKGSLGTKMLVHAPDDWSKVPPTIPLIIFSLVYHDITPVICSYLEGDLNRIRFCMVIGSLVPLLCLVIWDAVMLGLPAAPLHSGVTGALDLLPNHDRSISSCLTAAQVLVEPFSLLAVGTSLIGTLLGFSSFFREQIRSSRSKKQQEDSLGEPDRVAPGHNGDLISLLAMAAAVAPTLITSASVANAFDAATDFAGGYCMTILYGVLPPAMAWSLKLKKQEGGNNPYIGCGGDKAEDDRRGKLLQAKPTLIGAGLVASGVAMLQVVNDCTNLIPSIGLN